MAQDTIVPRYYEMESFRRSVNRKLWIGMTGLALVALFSLGLALIAFARPVPVVVFDQEGRPVLFEDTASPRREITDIRIEHFAKEFITTYAGVDSANIVEDLEKALNMMTPVFRKVVSTDQDELAERKKYVGQNIRSSFSEWKVRIGKYDPGDTAGKIYILASGKMTFEPRFGEVEGEGEVAKWFMTQLVLQRVPVTKISIHGLLADYCHTRMFNSKEALEKYQAERARRP